MKLITQINQREAQKISNDFSKYFDIPICWVYFVNKIYGISARGLYYSSESPQHMIIERGLNTLGTVLHELVHHLVQCRCGNIEESFHSWTFQRYKRKVIKWAELNYYYGIDYYPLLKAVGDETFLIKNKNYML